MINFFRRIRRNLLPENKFSKYLLYAIGEIVLVVIGILIALQINNWNETRKNNIKEVQFLERFKEDLTNSKDELVRVIKKTELVFTSADSILKLKREEIDIIPLNDFVGCIMDGTGFTVYQTQEGTIQDIMGSGNLDLIKNNELRLAIGSWEANLKGIREWEILNKNSSNEYYEFLRQNINLYKVDNRELPVDEDLRNQLMNNRLFLNYIRDRKRLSTNLNSYYKKEEPRIDSLLITIDKELKISSDD